MLSDAVNGACTGTLTWREQSVTLVSPIQYKSFWIRVLTAAITENTHPRHTQAPGWIAYIYTRPYRPPTTSTPAVGHNLLRWPLLPTPRLMTSQRQVSMCPLVVQVTAVYRTNSLQRYSGVSAAALRSKNRGIAMPSCLAHLYAGTVFAVVAWLWF